MTRRPPHRALWPVTGALAGLVLLALPYVRRWMEADMTRHMLVQYPLIALAGFILALALPTRWLAKIKCWNVFGINGLFATALILALLMIPRLLDLALVDGRVELAKWLALLACGMALRLSWRPAGLLMQGFFLGNVLPMMAVVGYLYASSPVRVCNAYLLDDQARLGQWLVWISAGVALAWFAGLARTLMQREDAALTPLDSRAGRTGPASR
ncbi:MAG: hypothetical protein PSV26_20360 [Polaromonas sp.]|uniref:hypothetical protein n=1 Tax=Polaromonas sp. TaxID=1869339 RepID=UPI00248778BB|nr:hypothetical protein [Polaromonas sp.]MDI1239842.1 hypothetical protein [Polaromonas sp.]